MTLTNSDIADLTAFRRDLHRHPEISGEERETARRVVAALASHPPDTILTGLGGHGVGVQLELPLWCDSKPAGHCLHALAPVASWNLPEAHCEQLPELDTSSQPTTMV